MLWDVCGALAQEEEEEEEEAKHQTRQCEIIGRDQNEM
jgi:hypothetical protein